jgi:hypothetical protein
MFKHVGFVVRAPACLALSLVLTDALQSGQTASGENNTPSAVSEQIGAQSRPVSEHVHASAADAALASTASPAEVLARSTKQAKGSPEKPVGTIIDSRGNVSDVLFEARAAKTPGYDVEGFWQRQREYDSRLRAFREQQQLEEQSKLEQDLEKSKAAQKEASEQQERARAAAANMSPSDVQALLRKALHQATLDTAMEDHDGNSYKFNFPPNTKLSDRFKGDGGRKTEESGEPASPSRVLPAQAVATIPQLRQAWFEAELVALSELDGGRHSYEFKFPDGTLQRHGLLDEQPNH